MPRADPTRSDYAASRHLLRHLDEAAELRRNPLVQRAFSLGEARDARARNAALARVRGTVLAAFTATRLRARGPRQRIAVARMHAVLLRCELERATLSTVASELGLSERQARRERRAAHEVFSTAFQASSEREQRPLHTTGALRLALAAALYELGLAAIALRTSRMVAEETPDRALRFDAERLIAQIQRSFSMRP